MQNYFAYGMNMNLSHMDELVPGTQCLGTGVLPGYRFLIADHTYASVTPDPEGRVFGAIFELSEAAEAILDAFEGVSEGLYLKQTLSVYRPENAERLDCLVYISENTGVGTPDIRYIEQILEGAVFHNLPCEYISFLRSFRKIDFENRR